MFSIAPRAISLQNRSQKIYPKILWPGGLEWEVMWIGFTPWKMNGWNPEMEVDGR